VTLDSDDIEVLLNAAAATAKIESLLSASRNDPAIIRLQAKGQIEVTLDRVNRKRAQAIRNIEDQNPHYGQIPDNDQDKERMRMLYHAPAGYVLTRFPEAYADLRARGLVVAGQISTILRWGDGTQDAEPSEDQAVRLTDLGRRAYEESKS